jgi:hypothetical protein
MSGTGQRNTAAPTRLTPIAVDQPIGQDSEGKLIFPSQYFAQSYTRVLAYLGQPGASSTGGGGSGGSNLTISEQLTMLAAAIVATTGELGNGVPGLAGRVAALERRITDTQVLPRPPLDRRAASVAKIIAYWGM